MAAIGVPAEDFQMKYLRNNSSKDMAVNGSVSSVTFEYTVPADEKFIVSRCNILVEDNGLRPSNFGGNNPLTNGVIIRVLDDDDITIMKIFNDDEPLITIGDFSALTGRDVDYLQVASDRAAQIRWTFDKHSGSLPLLLYAGQHFQAIVQDDLSGLDNFWMCLQGRIA